jgi:hypothetical protein
MFRCWVLGVEVVLLEGGVWGRIGSN